MTVPRLSPAGAHNDEAVAGWPLVGACGDVDSVTWSALTSRGPGHAAAAAVARNVAEWRGSVRALPGLSGGLPEADQTVRVSRVPRVHAATDTAVQKGPRAVREVPTQGQGRLSALQAAGRKPDKSHDGEDLPARQVPLRIRRQGENLVNSCQYGDWTRGSIILRESDAVGRM